MSLKPLNSEGGFGIDADTLIIRSDGGVQTVELSVDGFADLGNVENIKILGGNANQVVVTDGSGNLSFADQTGGLDVDGGQTPVLIPEGETFTVVENRQAFFQLPIEIEGDLVVDGVLIEIPTEGTTDDLVEGNTNLFFTVARFNEAASNYNGNIDTSGNISASTFKVINQIESEVTSLPDSGTIVIDMSGARLSSTEQLTGDITFSSTNVATGREVTIRVVNGPTTRNLNFPTDWVFVGGKPIDISANKSGILNIVSFGSNNFDIIARWLVEE